MTPEFKKAVEKWRTLHVESDALAQAYFGTRDPEYRLCADKQLEDNNALVAMFELMVAEHDARTTSPDDLHRRMMTAEYLVKQLAEVRDDSEKKYEKLKNDYNNLLSLVAYYKKQVAPVIPPMPVCVIGTVTEVLDGAPIHGAQATLTAPGEKVHEAYTDAAGMYYFSFIPALEYTLVITKPEYSWFKHENFVPRSGRTTRVNAPLSKEQVKRNGIVSGRVADAMNHSRLNNVSVHISNKDLVSRTVLTDADGNYGHIQLAAGIYTISTQYKGWLRFEGNITVKEGQHVSLDIELKRES